MATEKRFSTTTIVAGQNLTNLGTGQSAIGMDLHRAITVAGVIAGAPQDVYGLLKHTGMSTNNNSGDNITVAYEGEMKYVATGAIAAGAWVSLSTSGSFISAVSGSLPLGKNGELSVVSGGVGRGQFDFRSLPTAVESINGA